MHPKIETKGPMHFIGVSDVFISVHSPDANNFEVIAALWGRFCGVTDVIPNPVDQLSYGLIYSDGKRSRDDEYFYLAAVRVSSPETTAPGLVSYSSVESSYALVQHKGPIASIGETLRAFGEWLKGSDYRQAPGAEIEVYPAGYDPGGEESLMETWIPVMEKRGA